MKIRSLVSIGALALALSLGAMGSASAHPGGHVEDPSLDDSVGDMVMTLVPSTAEEPGAYAYCRGTTEIDAAAQPPSGEARLLCYIDAYYEFAGLNFWVMTNPAETLGPNSTNLPICPTSGGDCGDGIEGPPPPYVGDLWASAAPAHGGFADVDQTHVVLSGSGNFYHPDHGGPNGEVHVEGCYYGVEGSQIGPNIYARATLPLDEASNTSTGTVDLWLHQPDPPNCEPAAGPPPPPPNGFSGTVTLTERGHTTGVPAQNQYDSDGDGCSETQELRDTPATGGLRDPFNPWDFMDQYTGAPPSRDRIVGVGDIGAVVVRFGTSGDGYASAATAPTAATGYHVSADRNGSLRGSNQWNLKPPDGSVSVGDIGAVVAQFGHSCVAQ